MNYFVLHKLVHVNELFYNWLTYLHVKLETMVNVTGNFFYHLPLLLNTRLGDWRVTSSNGMSLILKEQQNPDLKVFLSQW